MYCHLSPHDEVPTNILGLTIAYLPVHFASLCVDHPRDSAAIPAVIALIETKMTCGILYDI